MFKKKKEETCLFLPIHCNSEPAVHRDETWCPLLITSADKRLPTCRDRSRDPEETGGTSPVAAGGGWGGLGPPPPMGGVGGSGTGAVRARVAELNAATGAVVNRTFPLRVRTEVVDAETQTPLAFTFVFPEGGWTL